METGTPFIMGETLWRQGQTLIMGETLWRQRQTLIMAVHLKS